jgi:rfaE bifunctional protein kinase chain/domain
VDGIARDARISTIRKTRFMVGDVQAPRQQVFRMDHHADEVLHEATEEKILTALDEAATAADVLLVSDHGHSVLTENVAARVREIADDGKMVCVDSNRRYDRVRGARIVTPNQREAEYTAGVLAPTEEDVVQLGFRLLETLETAAVLMTRGNQGMILFEGGGNFTKIPVRHPGEVVDVTGAGDTVASVVALALAAGAEPLEAAKLASHAAGLVVMKSGARTVPPEALLDEILAWEEGER